MRIIGGSGNWRLNAKCLKGGDAGIGTAVTPDTRAVIPERIFDKNVTAVFDHALALTKRELKDSDIIITTSLPYSEPARERLVKDSESWDNSHLEELFIPGSVREVGNFAFHNLRRLRILGLSDSVTSWGRGAASGLRALDTIYVECRGEDIELNPVPYILEDSSGELRAVIERGEETIRLIFPEYQEVYTETPHSQAQYLQFYLTGAGYPYHHSFHAGKLSLRDYDSLWEKYLTMGYELSTAVRLSLSRLLYPALLEDKAAARYREFVAAHIDEALIALMEDKDYQGIGMVLNIASPSREALKRASRLAGEDGNIEARARMLYELHMRFPKGT